MTLIINPGSGDVAMSGEGWANTEAGARAEAQKWFDRMTDDGLRDIVLLPDMEDLGDGRWRFGFQHTVTGVVCHLDTHGITDIDAFMKSRIFYPRVYWRGSSSGEPTVEDWAAPGFEVLKTLRAAS